MKQKPISMVLALGLAAALLTGCASSGTSAPAAASSAATEAAVEASTADASQAETTEAEGDVRTVIAMDGNELEVPAQVDTIISLAPSTTDLLIDLGLSGKIIAVDTYSMDSYAPELPEGIPSFDMMNPDNEQIVALAPDIVFTTGMSYAWGEDVFASAREAGVFIVDIESQASLQEIVDSIIFIGECAGERDAAEAIAQDMTAFLDEVGAAVSESDAAAGVVLFELSTPSADFPTIYSVGPDSYIDEILTLCGAVNAAADTDTPWPVLTEEAAIGANPDVIITTDNYTPDVENVILTSEGWENVNAVVNGNVYLIDADKINRPNHHVCDSIMELLELFYPGEFSGLESPFEDAMPHAA